MIKTKLANAYTKFAMARCGVMPIRDEKKEKGDHLVEVLGTVIIAVVLLILFRKQIGALFNNALNQTSNKTTNLFTDL